jgi:hypothetical protein
MSIWALIEGQLGNLFWALVPLFIGIIAEKWLRVSLLIEKLISRYRECNFAFVCELEGNNKKIKSNLEIVLKKRGYTISYDEKGYRTLLTATKGDLEAIKLRILDEDTLHISLDSPIQTIVSSVSNRLSELIAILESVKEESNAKVELASLQVSLPYHPLHKIKAPKGMEITDYRVELLDKNRVKIIVTLNNILQVNSTNFTDLLQAYRSII